MCVDVCLGVFKWLACFVNLNDKKWTHNLGSGTVWKTFYPSSTSYTFLKLENLSSFFSQKYMYIHILVYYAFSTAKIVARVHVAEVLKFSFFLCRYIITHVLITSHEFVYLVYIFLNGHEEFVTA